MATRNCALAPCFATFFVLVFYPLLLVSDCDSGEPEAANPSQPAPAPAATAPASAGTPIQVNDTAPDFELPNAAGETIRLADLRKQGPVIITWYRGGWCPFCNRALKALQQHLPEFQNLGASLVAISPESPDGSLTVAQQNELQFEVFSDPANSAASSYGLLYPNHDRVYNGQELPIPATVLVDSDGAVCFVFANEDYKYRADPAALLAVLEGLQ